MSIPMASTPLRPRNRDDFRIAIICALPVEAEMVQSVFDKDWADEDIDFRQSEGDQNAYTTGVIGKHNVVLAYMPGMGGNNAAAVAAGLRSSYHRIDFAFVVGICGVTPKHPGTKEDIVLGDCVISTTVIQYDYGRQYPGLFKRKTGIEDTLGRANTSIRTSIAKLQTAPNLKRLLSRLQHHLAALQKEVPNLQYPGYKADWLFEKSYIHEHHGRVKTCDQCEKDSGVCKQDCSVLRCDGSKLVKRVRLQSNNLVIHPRVHFGRYGSANTVMKSGEHRERLFKKDGIIAFEMEGAGVWDNLPTIIVKSACDYADSHKNKNWQRYAAATAAAGLKSILEQWRAVDSAQASDRVTHVINAGFDIGEAVHRADKLIRNHYRSGDRLLIKRLSGQELTLEKHYINLALIDRSAKAGDTEKQKSFSLAARLRLDASEVGQSISLQDLFESRKLADGKTVVNPRRIFIRGRPGIGKTTLCKKIVSEFLEGRLGSTLFDRLLWVPLRGLRPNQEEYGWQELLQDTFKMTNQTWKEIREMYGRQFDDTRFLSNTLFLFDGLDEISYRWKHDDPMCSFIDTIIRDIPNVIVTSRPQANTFSLEKFDLDLETLGFTTDQVSICIKNFVDDAGTVAEMERLIARKPLIRGLLRIPVQLDAFCFTWAAEDISDTFSAQDSITMTTLYQSITVELCKKDLRLLGKLDQQQRRPLSLEIEEQLKEELGLLGEIAFQGLMNDVVEFNPQHWNKLGSYLYAVNANFRTIFSSTLDRLSFMRTSDHGKDYTKRTYHFIHRTFQEFFAAKHFAECWQQDKPLVILQFYGRAGHKSEKAPFTFIQEEKYSSRLNTFWRFVAGIVCSMDEMGRFFGQLHDEPLDLLGATHRRLLMCCLSEAIPFPGSEMHDFYVKEVELLQQELVTEYHVTGVARLGAEVEFPEDLLCKFLQSDLELPYTETLRQLQQRSVLGKQAIEAVVGKLTPDYAQQVQLEAVRTLWSHSTSCSQGILLSSIHILIASCKHEDLDVRKFAADILRDQPSLSKEAIDILVEVLKDKHPSVRELAANALKGQIFLAEDAINALIAALKDEVWSVRRSAAEALEGRSSLSGGAIEALLAALEDEDHDVQSSAANALRTQSSLSEKGTKALIAALKDEIGTLESPAAEVLKGQSSLSKAAVNLLIVALKNKDEDRHVRRYIRRSAIAALKKQSPLSEAVIVALTAALEDEDNYVRGPALAALGEQSSLSEAVVNALIAALEGADDYMQVQAARALKTQPSLPDGVINALVAALKDKDRSVRSLAASALGSQLSPSETAVNALFVALEDECSEVRSSAAGALGGQSSLSEVAVNTLIAEIKQGERALSHAAEVLSKQSRLSEAAIKALIAALEDKIETVRNSAVNALQGQSCLSEGAVNALIATLNNEAWDVRRSAVEALKGRPSLSEGPIKALLAALNDKNYNVRSSAAKVLGEQSSLSKEATDALVVALRDENWSVQYSAANALQGQSSLSEAAIKILASTLGQSDCYAYDILQRQRLFYPMIENFDVHAWKQIWHLWLNSGMDNDISCYKYGDVLYVWSDGVRHKIFTDPARIACFQEVVLGIMDNFL